MEDIYESAGARIKEIRQKRGYSRDLLAEKARISSKFLYEIETGKKGFSAETLYRISTELRANCDYILKGETNALHPNFNEELALVLEWFDVKKAGKLEELLKIVYNIANDG